MAARTDGGIEADLVRVAEAKGRLAKPLRRLVECLEREGKTTVVEFFCETESALDASVTPEDLQAVFMQRLALSGPVALQARVGAESLDLLDDVLDDQFFADVRRRHHQQTHDRRVGGATLEFGVSGLLINNNLVLVFFLI